MFSSLHFLVRKRNFKDKKESAIHLGLGLAKLGIAATSKSY
jgi:hypothetical protein